MLADSQIWDSYVGIEAGVEILLDLYSHGHAVSSGFPVARTHPLALAGVMEQLTWPLLNHLMF
jgi:hypothetical protein